MAAGNNNTGRRTGLPPVLFKVVLPLLLVLLLAGFYLSGQGTDGSEGTDITLRSDIKGEFSLDDMRKAVKEKQPSRSEEELSPDGGTGTDLEQLRDLIRENEGSFRSEETDTPVPVTAPPAVPVQHPVVAAASRTGSGDRAARSGFRTGATGASEAERVQQHPPCKGRGT